MKKIITIILLSLFILIPKISANSTYIESISTIFPNETFTVKLGVNSSTSIYGIIGTLNYDKSKISLISQKPISPFTTTLGTKLVADTISPKTGRFSFVAITFKATTNFKANETTSISFTNVTATDGNKNINFSNTSKTITMTTPKSSDNYLKEITIDNTLLKDFSKTKTSYTKTVENNISKTNIQAKTQDSKAKITGTGLINLKDYDNVVKLTVTAENGSIRTYTVNIIRLDKDGRAKPVSSNNKLKSLEINGKIIELIEDTFTYSLRLPYETDKLKVEADTVDSNAKVTYEEENLKVGLNTLDINVEAENKEVLKYSINIERLKNAEYITLEKLEETLKNTKKHEIVITFDNEFKISEELINIINEKNLELHFESKQDPYYKIKLGTSKDLKEIYFDTKDLILNNTEIDTLTNHAKYIMFDPSTIQLPNETIISFNIENDYDDFNNLELYYYKDNKLINSDEPLEIKENRVDIKLNGSKAYVLTKSEIEPKEEKSILLIVYPAIIVLETIAFGIYFYKKH